MVDTLKPYHSSDDDPKPVTPDRTESESSTERSQLALGDTMTDSTPHLKAYSFYCSRRQLTCFDVCDQQKTLIYNAETHQISSSPDVVLRQGPGKDAPIVALARFRWSRHLKLGLGDPDVSEKDIVWEDMLNVSKGIGHSQYRFEMTIDNQRRSFLWQRTRDPADGVSGLGKLASCNYKLVDLVTGDTVAVFIENWHSLRKLGKLQLTANLGNDWELMVVLAIAALIEKAS